MNVVEPGSFVTLHYRLAGADGADVVSTFGAGPATLSLGNGQLAAALEQRLVGLAEGARESFELPPGDAFGPRSEALLQRVSLRLLREHVDADASWSPGDVLRLPAPDSGGGRAGVVCAADDDALLVDFNHPLAGRAVRFDVHVLGVL